METWEADHKILDALRRGKGAFIEWGELARLLRMDRAALDARVVALRGCGYEIEERPGSGLRLGGEPESLTAEEVRDAAPSGFITEVRVFGVVGSTNELARRLAQEIPGVRALIVAEAQTRGRGRYRRAWFSPPGVGLWFSLLLWPKIELSRSSSLGLLAAVSVASAMRKRHGVPASVKWPNDVLIEGRKVCGILSELAESEGRTSAIVGIGINVNQREGDFPPELREVACSLRTHTGTPVDRVELLGAALAELAARYDRYDEEGFGPFRSEWENLSGMVGRRVHLVEGTQRLEGRVRGVSQDGALVIHDDRGVEHRAIAGDVEILDWEKT